MQERDATPAGSDSRLFVDQVVAVLAARVERGIEIRDAKADVMQTRTATGDESTDRGVGSDRFKEFDVGSTERHVHDAGAVDDFGAVAREAEYLGIERHRGIEIGDRNA